MIGANGLDPLVIAAEALRIAQVASTDAVNVMAEVRESREFVLSAVREVNKQGAMQMQGMNQVLITLARLEAKVDSLQPKRRRVKTGAKRR